MKKLILVAAVLVGAVTASQAGGVHVDIGIGLPLPRLPHHVIIGHPAPVYQPVCPPPVVVRPYRPPVVVHPCPPPVVYHRPGYWHRHNHHPQWRGYGRPGDRAYHHGRNDRWHGREYGYRR